MTMNTMTTLSATVAAALYLSSHAVLAAPTSMPCVGLDGQAILNNGQSAWNNENCHYEDENSSFSSTSSSSSTITHGDGESHPVKIGILPYSDYRPIFSFDQPASLFQPVTPFPSPFENNFFKNNDKLFDDEAFFKDDNKSLEDENKLFKNDTLSKSTDQLLSDGHLYSDDSKLFNEDWNKFNNGNMISVFKRDAESKKEEYEDTLIDAAKESVDVVRAGAGAVVDLAGKGMSALGDLIVGDDDDDRC